MAEYRPPVGTGAPKQTIETFAERFAMDVNLAVGGSIEEVVAATGGRLAYASGDDEDIISGSIIARALSDYTIYLSPHTSRLRDRFTIAHELGHLVLHLPLLKQEDPDAVMRATRWVDEKDPRQKRAEWEANWFAAALLMPKDSFVQIFDRGGLPEIQLVFNVSPLAAETRARSLGLIDR